MGKSIVKLIFRSLGLQQRGRGCDSDEVAIIGLQTNVLLLFPVKNLRLVILTRAIQNANGRYPQFLHHSQRNTKKNLKTLSLIDVVNYRALIIFSLFQFSCTKPFPSRGSFLAFSLENCI